MPPTALLRRYVHQCNRAKQPTEGSERLLWSIWKEHQEIVEVAPTGHAICDTCAAIRTEELSLEGLNDAASLARRKELEVEKAAHHKMHLREREFYDAAAAKARLQPEALTTLTIDAPTQSQFDLPSQAKQMRDTMKRLDGTVRWQHSKKVSLTVS